MEVSGCVLRVRRVTTREDARLRLGPAHCCSEGREILLNLHSEVRHASEAFPVGYLAGYLRAQY